MAQVFRRSTNTLAHVSLLAVALAVVGVGTMGAAAMRSSFLTGQDLTVEQPVPFSHEHHVGGLGLDCRYCHWSVESSSFAGLPPTETCMTCHAEIWTQAEMLAPVRESFRTGEPIAWSRVHDLADFVYFDHSIHVSKGVGCETCHGRVDRMPLMRQVRSLQMDWCLECHRNPAPRLRPREQVFTMGWRPEDQEELGARLAREYAVAPRTSCWTCHR